MSGVTRYTLDPSYDPMADCHCYPTIEPDTDGEYVTYKDYMTLLREYAEYKQEVGNANKKEFS